MASKTFKKGNPGGPGRPRLPPELAGAKKIHRRLVEASLATYLAMPVEELSVVLNDKTKPVLDHIICRIALLALKEGDAARLNFLLERIIGKVPVEEKMVPIKIKRDT